MSGERFLMKDGLGPPAVRAIAKNVKRVHADFPERAFVTATKADLDTLELRARVDHVAAKLRKYLPSDYLEALAVIVRTGAGWDDKGLPEPKIFAVWPLIDFVGAYGLEHFDASMDALARVTGLFTAEFAIRPFLDAEPKKAMAYLRRWTKHDDPAVRRLVSEGTRPRLPWGRRLKVFGEEVEPVVELLERLRDDPSETVRRSVANHLNDLAKTHPELVVERCRAWSRGASDERMWIIRHATRTLVKAGHAGALELLGHSPDAAVAVHDFTVSPSKLVVGEDLVLRFVLESQENEALSLVVDYAVHHVKADGRRTPKVFKLKRFTLDAGERLALEKIHRIRPITTRTYHPGRHAVELFVNGRSFGVREFDLEVIR